MGESKEQELADYADEDDVGETTAVVNVAQIRPSMAPAAPDRHVLVRMDGTHVGRLFAIEQNEVRLGRHPSSDVVIEDDGVSRRHARIVREADGYVLEDLGSANGSFVQGERVQRHRLRDGDLFQLGPSVLFRYAYTDANQQKMLQKLYEASVRDPLTGAYNREHFEERLRAELAFGRRHASQLSLVLFDLDHFKQINDLHGHVAGDAVLIAISERVSAGLRTEDVFARFGGEEFAVILRGIDLTSATLVAERLRERVAHSPVPFESTAIRITLSAGCAALSCCPDATPETIVALADRRLYAAKRGGRNRVVASD